MKDRNVLITGASSGIGRAIAQRLAEAGANVALAARHREKLERVAASLPAGTQSLVIPTDVSKEEDVARAVEETAKAFGSLDVLVNNAGYGIFKPIDEMTAEEFDGMIAVNLRGVFLGLKYGLARMYAQGKGGSIVTISSLAGKNGFSGGGGYCAGKFGVTGLMESAFHEARSRNVRVINIAPGSVDTPFFDDVEKAPPNRDKILQPDDVALTVLHTLSLPPRALIREVDIRPANPK